MAGGPKYILPMLLMAALQQLTRTMSDITASRWAYVNESDMTRLYVAAFLAYAVLHGASFFASATLFIWSGRRAGSLLHENACQSIIGAPLTWTSTQSPGRLTNRLSADQDCVDTVLPESMRSSVVMMANVAATLILMTIHKWYNFIAIAAILSILMVYLQYYRASSRELGRLAAIAKGPLQGHVVETIHGLPLVRAFQATSQFRNRCDFLIDECSRAYYPQFTLQRWLELRVTMAGNVLILLAALSTLLVTGPLALTSATMNKTLTVTRVLNWMIRRMADAELQFISVERLVMLCNESVKERIEYQGVGDVEREKSGRKGGSQIEFRNVTAHYSAPIDKDNTRPIVRALHNVSFTVHPGQRVGIVGRTGSGKSTLILTLFRAVEPIGDGVVLLDGRDTRSMSLVELRRSVSVIPQEPFLFSGTVRANLDPLDRYPDHLLWDAIDRCGLRPTVSSLDTTLSPSEWSLGQRQLLAVARVLLEQPTVLVMDEATASLDPDTEQLILDVVERVLAGCTVVSVAHRLAAVGRCERVIVLEGGRVVEEGAPGELLAQKSKFAQLASAASP
jgi:ABC-type multidrug transport system fused ATPase/permease subunit